MDDIIQSLSPIEQKIIPYLRFSVEEIIQKSGLDRTSVLRALKFLENKKLVQTRQVTKQLVDLGTNGIYYKKNHLPERTLLTTLEKQSHITIQEAKTQSKLSDNEFKVSLGVLKKKLLIELRNGKIALAASKTEITKKLPEETLLEKLPIEHQNLTDEDRFALSNLKTRKEIIEITEQKTVQFTLTDHGKKLAGKKITTGLLEEVTPAMIKNLPKNKQFRKYDIHAHVPAVHGGKKHFVNQAIEYGKKIWLELGFTEMTGTLTQTAFWNFDALFQPQDHPTRDMHDTFYIKDARGRLPSKEIVKEVKQAHEQGTTNSKGWNYTWQEDEAKKIVARTHTTCLSAQTLATLNPKKDLPAKFFSIGKNFRNETVDWSHGFEFLQTDGIVIDRNMNFKNLLGYLQTFFTKMGFSQVRFAPAYFPYTEPSVEITVFHPEKKVWFELGGAGMFRPEVVIPLLGEYIPVLAWGPGFDRILMDYYQIKDFRNFYANDLAQLRTKKAWMK